MNRDERFFGLINGFQAQFLGTGAKIMRLSKHPRESPFISGE
jgi:hypothetical protein